mgnify:FL=1|jgi:hypothetical protein
MKGEGPRSPFVEEVSMSQPPNAERPSGVGVLPLGIALAVTLLAGYGACWLVAASPFAAPFTHAWLQLFSAEPAGSTEQLIEGSIFSAVAAWFAALIFAPVYNLIARADRII